MHTPNRLELLDQITRLDSRALGAKGNRVGIQMVTLSFSIVQIAVELLFLLMAQTYFMQLCN